MRDSDPHATCLKKGGRDARKNLDVSAAKVDRDPQVARSSAERVEAIGSTHLLNPGERWPPRDLNVMSHLAAEGLDGRRAGRQTRKL